MLNVNIITVGKLKENYLKEACAEYLKRLGLFCKPYVIELPESRIRENPSDKEIERALLDEGKLIQNLLNVNKSFNITMCIEGKQLSSVDLSNCIQKAALDGNSTINFVIGSSYGIAEEIKQKSHFQLSMSKMTFPHQLARVMLLEQIYRSFQISSNGKYHK